MDATFFTVSDARYFLGAVALVNSLRIQGHTEEIVVLDCGLTLQQRSLLATQCTLVPLSEQGAVNPTYYKIVAPRHHGKSTKVIIDSDMIVTGHLGEHIRAAESGKVVAYPDPESNRWFAEWEGIYELSSPPRRQVYLNAGVVFLNTDKLPLLLEQWWRACRKSLTQPTIAEGVADGPTAQADQDALNGVLMGNYPADLIAPRPDDECAQAEALERGVQITDTHTLACRYRGHRTLILHSVGAPKPWSSPQKIRKNAYVLLLREVLTRSDLAIRLPPALVPPWLQDSVWSRGVLAGYHYRNTGRHLGSRSRAFARGLSWSRVSWALRRRLARSA